MRVRALSVLVCGLIGAAMIAEPAIADYQYTVVPGDSLWSIAERNGVSVSALAAENGRSSAAVLPVGASLMIPSLTGEIWGYTNPFQRATGLVWERTDQGVDAQLNPGSPLLAFAPSQVEMIVADFYAGEPAIVFEITAGPLAGNWWYWAEQIQPTVSQGQTVAAGDTVATYAPAGTGIETGWWTPNGVYPLGHPGYKDGLATNAGGDFRYLLQALGANPGSGAGLSSGPTIGNTYYPTGNPGP
jgi:LysM repeat protein